MYNCIVKIVFKLLNLIVLELLPFPLGGLRLGCHYNYLVISFVGSIRTAEVVQETNVLFLSVWNLKLSSILGSTWKCVVHPFIWSEIVFERCISYYRLILLVIPYFPLFSCSNVLCISNYHNLYFMLLILYILCSNNTILKCIFDIIIMSNMHFRMVLLEHKI